MTRITIKHLRRLCDDLNKITGQPATPYTRTDAGLKANIGNYYIYQEVGGYGLCQIVNDAGGVTMLAAGRFVPAKELYQLINAYIEGYKLAQLS